VTRVYLFGIGSPEWQESTGHTVNAEGVPIPSRKAVALYPASWPGDDAGKPYPASIQARVLANRATRAGQQR
jgi:hypothetical protein